MKLYELTQAYTKIRDELATLEDPFEIESFAQTLAGLEGDINDKAENIAILIKEQDAEAVAIKLEEEALRSRRKALESKSDSLRRYLLEQMALVGAQKAAGPRAIVSVVNNQTKVVVHDLEALTSIPMYWKPYKWDESNLDKTKLKADLESGAYYNPVIATLERGQSLRIK